MLKRTATTDSPLAIRGRLPTKTRKIAKPKRDGPAPASDKYENLEQLAARIRVCPACPLCQSRTNAVPGEGKPNAKVMIIGEAPGANEDKTGRPFAGNAGRYLDHVLEGTGLERTDFFITNIVKCRPPS
ncbi:MAG TPA: uracil-DNA glycosylase, partial [Candidatus Dormibacteraeota bacterium]|nr:uracil-DNA glycosylase [Candidatus Dormibacteraeota bacterium]